MVSNRPRLAHSQLAALNRTNINVQELIVEAALNGGTEAVYHAVMLDPLTAAVCTLPRSGAWWTKCWKPKSNGCRSFEESCQCQWSVVGGRVELSGGLGFTC